MTILRLVFLSFIASQLIHLDLALAQEANCGLKIELLERKLAQLEKQMELISKENADLRRMIAHLGAKQQRPAREASGARKEKPVEERPIQVGGQIRFRPEVRDNADLRSSADDLDDLVGQRIRFHVAAKLAEDITGFVQFQDSRLWGAEISTISNDANTDLHQAFLQADNFLVDGLSLKVGRQELIYGNERLIGPLGWDNVGRSFDAVKLVYGKKGWSADFFAAKVNDRRSSRRGDGDQDFYGTYWKLLNDDPNYRLEIYGLYLRDGLRIGGEIAGKDLRSTRVFTLGTRHEGKFASGFYYDGELAFQFGRNGPDEHKALALAAKAGRTFKTKLLPRLGFEYDLATGDKDPNDGRSGEFINLFPTNHIHYGYIDYLGWRNMQGFRYTFSFRPMNELTLDIDYHRFFLHRAKGRWTSAGGAVLGFDPTGRSGTSLGQEVDFTLSFPYKGHVNFLAGYSLFLPGGFAKATRGDDPSHFAYVQTLISF